MRSELITSKNRSSGRTTDGSSRFPPEIVAVRLFYTNAKKKASVDLQADIAKKKKNANKKPSSTRPQDTVTFVESKTHFDRCPNPECHHYSLMHVQDMGLISGQNKAIQINNRAAMDVWIANGRQGKKPTNKKTVEQTLTCFCYKQNCRMSGSGKGCYIFFKEMVQLI